MIIRHWSWLTTEEPFTGRQEQKRLICFHQQFKDDVIFLLHRFLTRNISRKQPIEVCLCPIQTEDDLPRFMYENHANLCANLVFVGLLLNCHLQIFDLESGESVF